MFADVSHVAAKGVFLDFYSKSPAIADISISTVGLFGILLLFATGTDCSITELCFRSSFCLIPKLTSFIVENGNSLEVVCKDVSSGLI